MVVSQLDTPRIPLQGGVHPDQMPQTPQLVPLDVKEHHIRESIPDALLTLCLRESPAILQRKLISTPCICDLMTIGEGWNKIDQ